jgi:tetratricopeptide (TPR) repeat protein
MSKAQTPDNFRDAINLFEHALSLDPQSVEVQTHLAFALALRVTIFMTDSAMIDLARAEGLIDQALAASPGISHAHYVKGTVLRLTNRWEQATGEFEMARSLNPNSANALQGLGWCKLYSGLLDEVIPVGEQAIRLSPREPGIGFRYLLIGSAHLLRSHTDEAIVWLEKARSALPSVPVVRGRLAAAYALKGETEGAAAELAEARRLACDAFSSIARLKAGGVLGDVFTSIARSKSGGASGVPNMRAVLEATYFAGLRLAGMPEE